MGGSTDYAVLYDELGLAPGCSMEDLRRAYRRRVAQLHPDLHGPDTNIEALQRLNRLYGSAVDFHRSQGRLPGTSVASPATAPATATATAVEPAKHLVEIPDPPPGEPDLPRQGARRHLPALIIALLAIAIWLQECGHALPAATEAAPPSGVEGGHVVRDTARGKLVELGMHADEVRATLGAPLLVDNDRWMYGSSWIQLQCGRVVDWYNAPQAPIALDDPPPRSIAATATHIESRRCQRVDNDLE